MQLREGFILQGAHSYCCGCGEVLYCDKRYITLQLDNLDGTLRETDCAFSHFHNEHCVSMMIRNAQSKKGV